jgi:cytochrome P450
MLPAFHREQIAAAGDTMVEEARRALDGWRGGQRVHLYHWTRRLTLRVALRALLGLDPGRDAAGVDLAAEFERGLAYYGHNYFGQSLRGPGTPWNTMLKARRRLDELLLEEIARRRRAAEGERPDILSLLLGATDEDGSRLTDRQVRDQAMTLLFAGHDTTTSTVAFLFHELARNPEAADGLVAEQDEVLGGGAATAAQLNGELSRLEMAVDETLRLYPPAWIGPRRAIESFEFAGHRIPAGARVNYSSLATHRLPEVFDEPRAFRPERFSPERKAALPKGAYVPFGGGSRICIGMRFAQLEVKAIATSILQRFRLEPEPGYRLRVREMPTLSPRDGLPMTIRAR